MRVREEKPSQTEEQGDQGDHIEYQQSSGRTEQVLEYEFQVQLGNILLQLASLVAQQGISTHFPSTNIQAGLRLHEVIFAEGSHDPLGTVVVVVVVGTGGRGKHICLA